MNRARGTDENWAQAWVEEQREKLRAAQGRSEEANEASSAAHSFAEWSKQLGNDLLAAYDKLLRSGMPHTVPLGWAREHDQEWRDLAGACAEHQKAQAELLAILARVQAQALDRVEHIVRERRRENRPFAHVRELYDLWIECGEEAYASVAHGDEFCRAQAALANAGVRVRAQQQKLIERASKQFDLPTRAELNSIERELRALRERLDRLDPPTRHGTSSAAKARAPSSRKRTAKKKQARA